jgi:hypothetical protein
MLARLEFPLDQTGMSTDIYDKEALAVIATFLVASPQKNLNLEERAG